MEDLKSIIQILLIICIIIQCGLTLSLFRVMKEHKKIIQQVRGIKKQLKTRKG